jgi:S1-C subfamily serine protease
MVAEDGLMITNKHVVDGSNGNLKVKILNADGKEEERNAHVVKINEKQDLALLQVDKQKGETFAALPLSQRTDWKAREPIVVMGNANGEGKISMAKTRFSGMMNQDKIPFDQQPPDVAQGRTMYRMDSVVPHGYSGGVVLSVPGSERTDTGVERLGTSAIRGITDYSNLTNKAYFIPAARVQFMLDEYRKEQVKSGKK